MVLAICTCKQPACLPFPGVTGGPLGEAVHQGVGTPSASSTTTALPSMCYITGGSGTVRATVVMLRGGKYCALYTTPHQMPHKQWQTEAYRVSMSLKPCVPASHMCGLAGCEIVWRASACGLQIWGRAHTHHVQKLGKNNSLFFSRF